MYSATVADNASGGEGVNAGYQFAESLILQGSQCRNA